MFAVATINSVEYQPLADITNLPKIEYCNIYGYSFYSLVGFKYSPNMGFNKIHFILDLFKQHPDLEWLLWCDCDAMITNLTIRIEDKIDNNYHFILPLDNNGINAGNLLIRNTREGRDYLQMIIDSEESYSSIHDAEQQVITDTYNNYKHIIKVVPQRYMNSYEPQCYIPHTYASKDVAGNSGAWEQGDWIVHWPGLNMGVRLNRAKELTKLIIKDKMTHNVENDPLAFVVNVLKESNEDNLASQVIDVFANKSFNIEQWNQLAKLYFIVKNYSKAEECTLRVLSLCTTKEEINSARSNLFLVYQIRQPTKAKEILQQQLKDDPTNINLKILLIETLYLCNEKDESANLLSKLELTNFVDNPNILLDLKPALGDIIRRHLIRQGNIKEGMQYTIFNRKLNTWWPVFPIPKWDGTIEQGKNILIVSDVGIGDEFITIRFSKHIYDAGMKCSFVSNHNLSSIISRIPYVTGVFSFDLGSIPSELIKKFDCWVPAHDLQSMLNTDTLWYGPYLTIDDKIKIEIDSKLFNIGIKWSGSTMTRGTRGLPIDKNDLYESLQEFNCKLYSLEQDSTDFDLSSYENTLAVINNMDLVISVDTSVAHASGALGKKTIVLVQINDFHVWAEGKDTSSWYGDNVILIRQEVPNSWKEVFPKLNEAVRNLINDTAS